MSNLLKWKCELSQDWKPLLPCEYFIFFCLNIANNTILEVRYFSKLVTLRKSSSIKSSLLESLEYHENQRHITAKHITARFIQITQPVVSPPIWKNTIIWQVASKVQLHWPLPVNLRPYHQLLMNLQSYTTQIERELVWEIGTTDPQRNSFC